MGKVDIDRSTLTTDINGESVDTDSIVKAETTQHGTVIYTLDNGSTIEAEQKGWD